MNMEWVDGAAISVALRDGEVTLSANRAGLLSIARQLSALAEAAPGAHMHYDAYNSLEEGSPALIIERTA